MRLQSAGCVFALEEAEHLLRAADSPDEAEALLQRRLSGEPLEYVLGWAEFLGRRVRVVPGVFIPRRRTEFLASAALESASRWEHPVILDLCCGSGALSTVFAGAFPEAELHAADLSSEAVAAARLNLGERAEIHQGDLFAALPFRLRGSIDVVAANAPYVPTDQLPFLPREARIHEPAQALDGGREGLELLRRIAADAPAWLSSGGELLVECSEGQAPGLQADFRASGFQALVRTDAETGTAVVTGVLR
ncbi:putative protein N(5)-glutamine methyltransferase [Arthrobacter koreensis]|uniref:putative protein N(5)-glutamine methyltransferase n=1 Tax=Arthrobacter koreensis TaxID=199136 RepID=UPI002DC03827|nr:putative protein N(5)-glutamine methyltransferase [Arthrobacter koreensis]MEB7504914.1 putative protein N(5)-glutamine methyltransferase [Arthrobacter koreensis]